MITAIRAWLARRREERELRREVEWRVRVLQHQWETAMEIKRLRRQGRA